MDIIDREIEKCLRQRPNYQNITVSARAFESGIVKTGLNYCSKVFRFTIFYEKQSQKCVRSFFVKAPYGLRYYKLLTKFQMFTKEIYMYDVVFPLFKAFLPNQSLQPDFYGTDGGEALILEDLTYSGYKLLDGHKQMDFEHSAIALKWLARFHALGIKMHRTEPKILQAAGCESQLTSNLLQLKKLCALFNARVEKVVRRAAPSYAAQHPEVMHLLRTDSYLIETLVQELRPERYSFNVLNHGDFHTNNIMFVDDEFGQVKGAKCLDFQSCTWSSPAIDIVVFAVTSVSPPVFQQYFPLLLEIYVQTLNATLQYLKCNERLDVDSLLREIETVDACWMKSLIGTAPLVVSDLRNASDDAIADQFIDGDHYVCLTKFWIPYFIEKGFFTKFEQAAMAKAKFDQKLKRNSKQDIRKPDNGFLSGFVLLSFDARSSVFLRIPSTCATTDVTDTHSREIFMFENVLPHIFEPRSGQHYAPLCHAITKTKGLVLEDLEAQGYRTCNSKAQLDLDHSRVALATLARYHALSARYIRTAANRQLVHTLEQPPQYDPALMKFGYDLYDRFLSVAQTLVSRSAHQKLCQYREQFEETWVLVSGAMAGISSCFRVVTHGNLWTNNILFRYDDDGRVCQAKMVDWRQSRVALPVLDLVYFFLSSVPFEVFAAHRDTLLNEYVDTLNQTLGQLECNCRYTRSDLDADLNQHKALFPMFASCILQIVMTERDQPLFDLQPSKEISGGNYPSVVAKWLNYFVKNGIA